MGCLEAGGNFSLYQIDGSGEERGSCGGGFDGSNLEIKHRPVLQLGGGA